MEPQPAEWLAQIAQEVKRLVREYGRGTFEKQIAAWLSAMQVARKARVEFAGRQRDCVEKNFKPESHDRERGGRRTRRKSPAKSPNKRTTAAASDSQTPASPAEGWVWHGTRNRNGELVFGFLPLELATPPQKPLPVPFTDRPLAIAEKFAVLAAIHDLWTLGAQKLLPVDETLSATDADQAALSVLLQLTQQLSKPESDLALEREYATPDNEQPSIAQMSVSEFAAVQRATLNDILEDVTATLRSSLDSDDRSSLLRPKGRPPRNQRKGRGTPSHQIVTKDGKTLSEDEIKTWQRIWEKSGPSAANQALNLDETQGEKLRTRFQKRKVRQSARDNSRK